MKGDKQMEGVVSIEGRSYLKVDCGLFPRIGNKDFVLTFLKKDNTVVILQRTSISEVKRTTDNYLLIPLHDRGVFYVNHTKRLFLYQIGSNIGDDSFKEFLNVQASSNNKDSYFPIMDDFFNEQPTSLN